MTNPDAVPGSPPALSISMSSPSSSIQSSPISPEDGVISCTEHFEDIGLGDDQQPPRLKEEGQSEKEEQPPTPGSVTGRSNSDSHATPLGREIVNDGNNGNNGSHTQPSESVKHRAPDAAGFLALPSKRSLRKSRTGTSNPLLVPEALHIKRRSRSSSPSNLSPTLSPHSLPSSTPSTPSTSPGLRQPRNRARKTAKEIEDEFHDSDEDLPDDASLWNVPMSPRLYRTASTAASSVTVSTDGSPERTTFDGPLTVTMTPATPSSLAFPRGAHSSPLASRPFPPPGRGRSMPTLPTTPDFERRPRSGYGVTRGTMQDRLSMQPGRTKSLESALWELGEEAMNLTEALNAHAETQDSEGRQGHGNAAGDTASPPGPSNGASARVGSQDDKSKRRRSKAVVVELPPLRKGAAMIDPLPVSKEKEKVLSRTRPSWLPPKDPKEEERHLKEYKRMMRAAAAADAKRAAIEADAAHTRAATSATLQRLWDEHVLGTLPGTREAPNTRELVWRGIPSAARPAAWKAVLGNDLGLTDRTYQKALERAQEARNGLGALPSEGDVDRTNEQAWLGAIDRDVAVTMPGLGFFQQGQPLHVQLTDLLAAYSFYRADVGYAFGIHLPAALLLIVYHRALDRSDAAPAFDGGVLPDVFVALANLMNRPLASAFLTGDPAGTKRVYGMVMQLTSSRLPSLYGHFFGRSDGGELDPSPSSSPSQSSHADGPGLGLAPERLLEPLLRTFFLHEICTGPSRGLALQLALRIWDVLVFDGDLAVVRACVGVLAALESRLYGNAEDVMALLGWNGDFGGLGAGAGRGGRVEGGERSTEGGKEEEEEDGEEERKRIEEEEMVERVMRKMRDIGREPKSINNSS